MTALAILSCVCFIPSTQAELISNGSFENATGLLPDDWMTSGNLAVINTQGESDGANALAFSFGNLPSNGVLSQSFSTTTGAAYDVAFDFGKYSVNQPLQIARLDVDVFNGIGFLGTQLLDQSVSDGTPATGDPNSTDSFDVYSSFQFSFVATGSSATLRFTDFSDGQAGGGGFDAMLDNVRVTSAAVPEPATFGLLAIGGMATGIRIRRRRSAQKPADASRTAQHECGAV